MEYIMGKKVVCSCGHEDEITIGLTPQNEKAWTRLWEITPCTSCLKEMPMEQEIGPSVQSVRFLLDLQ